MRRCFYELRVFRYRMCLSAYAANLRIGEVEIRLLLLSSLLCVTCGNWSLFTVRTNSCIQLLTDTWRGSSEDWTDHQSDEMPLWGFVFMAPRSSHFASACMLLHSSIDDRQWDRSSHTLYLKDKLSFTAGIRSLPSEVSARLFSHFLRRKQAGQQVFPSCFLNLCISKIQPSNKG